MLSATGSAPLQCKYILSSHSGAFTVFVWGLSFNVIELLEIWRHRFMTSVLWVYMMISWQFWYVNFSFTTLDVAALKHFKACAGVRNDSRGNVGFKIDPRTCITWLFLGPVSKVNVLFSSWSMYGLEFAWETQCQKNSNSRYSCRRIYGGIPVQY